MKRSIHGFVTVVNIFMNFFVLVKAFRWAGSRNVTNALAYLKSGDVFVQGRELNSAESIIQLR